MQIKILPFVGIIVVTVILVILNEFTEMTFIQDYALIFIIAGMSLGVWLTKLTEKSKDKNDIM
jgi:positive regulator of sigma E activity